MNESMDAAEEDKFWTPRGRPLRSLHELLLSLNKRGTHSSVREDEAGVSVA